MCMDICAEKRLTRSQRHTDPTLRCKRDAYEKATCYNAETMWQCCSSAVQEMVWCRGLIFFSNAYKAVLHLKYHQLSSFTASQQRTVFNKNNDRIHVDVTCSRLEATAAPCVRLRKKKVNVWNNLFKNLLFFPMLMCYWPTRHMLTTERLS